MQSYCRHVLQMISLAANSNGESIRSIGLTSIRSGSGVSTLATHLAMAAAQASGEPVLLVDASFEAAELHVRAWYAAAATTKEVKSGWPLRGDEVNSG